MSKKRSTTDTPTTRLNRKTGAAPKVARKPRLSEEAIVELTASAPAAPVATPVAPPPIVIDEFLASLPEPPVSAAPPSEPALSPASERLAFRPVPPFARRPSPGELFRGLVERARREWQERTADVRERLRSRFPLLAAIHRSLSRRV